MKHKLYKLTAALLLALLLVGAASAAGGDGTAENPYIIQTPAELQSMQNDLSAYYVLANDIDMSGISNWTPIGSSSNPATTAFHGSLDGNGHTIRNLNIDLPEQNYVGLFAVIYIGATISDLNFENCTITGNQNVGVLYGRCNGASGTTTEFSISDVDIENCTVSAGSSYVGGLCGSNGNSAIGTISYCDTDNCLIESTGSSYVGGICGFLSDGGSTNVEIIDCSVVGSEIRSPGNSYVGGICGYLSYGSSNGYAYNCIVRNCHIWAGSYAVGGICAHLSNGGSNGYAYNCIVEGCLIESTGSYSVGGICGYLSNGGSTIGLVENCVVRNCIMAGSYNVGGICGYLSDGGSNGNANDNVVENCTVRARNSYAGGIAGCKYATGFGNLSGNSVSSTTILASSYAGGICSTFER